MRLSKNRASAPALLKPASLKSVVISSLSGSTELSLSAEMKVSKSVVVSRFSTGSGFEPGASAALTNRCVNGRGEAVLSSLPPHETSVTAVRTTRSEIARRIVFDPSYAFPQAKQSNPAHEAGRDSRRPRVRTDPPVPCFDLHSRAEAASVSRPEPLTRVVEGEAIDVG